VLFIDILSSLKAEDSYGDQETALNRPLSRFGGFLLPTPNAVRSTGHPG
jgi:hypothetical protein